MLETITFIAALCAIVSVVGGMFWGVARMGSHMASMTSEIRTLREAAATALKTASEIAIRADRDTRDLAKRIEAIHEKLDQYVTFDHCDRMRETCNKRE